MLTYGGVPKTIEVTSHLFADAFDGKIAFDGSSVFGMTDVSNSDLLLVPDLSSFRRLPIYDSEFGNVAVVMCYAVAPDGKPAAGCTRSILNKELAKMGKHGFDKMNVGFEPEFFIISKDSKDVSAHLDTGTYASAEGEDDVTAHVRREIMFELERAGIIPLTSHHERAPSACEITYKYADCMTTCDNLIIGKLITKKVASKNGMFASFEPKPFEGVNGSGLHTNISLAKGGKNIFASESGISDCAKHFLAGVLESARGLCFLTTGNHEDAYKRLVKGFEAPTNICWGYHNRSAMIRIPKASREATRIEIRSPDPTMNPYLGCAGILRAGLDGIGRKLLPSPSVDFDAWEDMRAKGIVSLPSSLSEARREFTECVLLRDLVRTAV